MMRVVVIEQHQKEDSFFNFRQTSKQSINQSINVSTIRRGMDIVGRIQNLRVWYLCSLFSQSVSQLSSVCVFSRSVKMCVSTRTLVSTCGGRVTNLGVGGVWGSGRGTGMYEAVERVVKRRTIPNTQQKR